MNRIAEPTTIETGHRIAYLPVRRQQEGIPRMQPLKKVEFDEGAHLEPLPREITWAATVDVRNVEHEITELMIRRACEEMEDAPQFPFGGAGDAARVVPRSITTARTLSGN